MSETILGKIKQHPGKAATAVVAAAGLAFGAKAVTGNASSERVTTGTSAPNVINGNIPTAGREENGTTHDATSISESAVTSTVETSLPTTLPDMVVNTTTTTASLASARRPEARPVASPEYSPGKKLQIANQLLAAIEDPTIPDPEGFQRINEKLTLTGKDGTKLEIEKPIALSNSGDKIDLLAPQLDHSKVFYIGLSPKADATPDENGYVPHVPQIIDPSDYAGIEATPLSSVVSQPAAGKVRFEKRGIAVVGIDLRSPELAHDVGSLRPVTQTQNPSTPEQPGEIIHGQLPETLPS